MSIVRVPEGAIALRAACPRCHAEPGVACTRSGGSVITALDGHSRGGTLYVCEDRLLPSLVCDFCGRDGVRWIAPARDGAWLACQTCGELLSLAKRGTLLERAIGNRLALSTRARGGSGMLTAGSVRAVLSDQFDLFWSNRDGPVRLVTMAEIRDAALKPEADVVPRRRVGQRVAPWWAGR